jgi:hypothetical protein
MHSSDYLPHEWREDTLPTPSPKIENLRDKATDERPKPLAEPMSGHHSKSADHPIEIDFIEMRDGRLVELVEHPTKAGQTCFAVRQGGEIRFLDKVEQDGQVFVPTERSNTILKSIRLPRGAESYGSVRDLTARLESLISDCVALDEKYVPVIANFVMSTWFVDRFEVAPYLSIVGLPQSGKTTLLRLLSLVCRRSLLVADISSASFYWACARFMATILVDETGTAGNSRALRHMLRAGTTRDVIAARNKEHLHSYGSKAITWLEPPDDPALNSRCILIPIFESKRTTLMRLEEPRIQTRAAQLRAQLLRFRLERFETVKPHAVPGDDELRPRTRDLLRAIAAPTAQDAERSQRLLEVFQSGQASPSEPLSLEQNVILHVLFLVVHSYEKSHYFAISGLSKVVNNHLKLKGEPFRLQPRKIGAVLTSLGFSDRKRTNTGWTIQLRRKDLERIHQLAARYGIDGFEFSQLASQGTCELCKAEGLKKEPPPPGAQESVISLKIC